MAVALRDSHITSSLSHCLQNSVVFVCVFRSDRRRSGRLHVCMPEYLLQSHRIGYFSYTLCTACVYVRWEGTGTSEEERDSVCVTVWLCVGEAGGAG